MTISPVQTAALVVLASLAMAAEYPRQSAMAAAEPTVATLVAHAADVLPAYHPEPVTIGDAAAYTPPDFAAISDVKARKAAFYDYLLPKIREANDEVARERAWLQSLAEEIVAGRLPTERQLAELGRIEGRYAVADSGDTIVNRIARLLRRVDVVPASLVLAQAAKESGWGTSRFAREGNNYFGIWCFYEGCGLTPLSRLPGRNHEVATFDSVADGVRYYIRTINTHSAYSDLRKMRATARQARQPLPGEALANGLVRYSERGMAYVREIQSMIRYNELHRFTRRESA